MHYTFARATPSQNPQINVSPELTKFRRVWYQWEALNAKQIVMGDDSSQRVITGDDGVQQVTMGGNGWQRVTTEYKYNIIFFLLSLPGNAGYTS